RGPNRSADIYSAFALPVALDEARRADAVDCELSLDVQKLERSILKGGVDRAAMFPGCSGDDVRRPLPQGQCGALAVAECLVARLEAVTIRVVRTHKLLGRAVQSNMVLEPREPVGQAGRMVRARGPVKGESSP